MEINDWPEPFFDDPGMEFANWPDSPLSADAYPSPDTTTTTWFEEEEEEEEEDNIIMATEESEAVDPRNSDESYKALVAQAQDTCAALNAAFLHAGFLRPTLLAKVRRSAAHTFQFTFADAASMAEAILYHVDVALRREGLERHQCKLRAALVRGSVDNLWEVLVLLFLP